MKGPEPGIWANLEESPIWFYVPGAGVVFANLLWKTQKLDIFRKFTWRNTIHFCLILVLWTVFWFRFLNGPMKYSAPGFLYIRLVTKELGKKIQKYDGLGLKIAIWTF
jgi:hypothetical protein